MANDAGVKAEFLVVMGVAGTGKTEIGQRLSQALCCPFVEADTLHSAENVERMRRGIGLTDDDRWPWLLAVCEAAQLQSVRPVVISCSVLKKRYRDLFRDKLASVSFLFLHGSVEMIGARLRSRQNHFASISLLEGQLATLEPPGPDESPMCLDISATPERIVAEALQRLVSRASSRNG